MLAAFFASIGNVITEMFGVVGQALNGGVNLIYETTESGGHLTNFGILVTIPVGAGLIWLAYTILRSLLTLRR